MVVGWQLIRKVGTKTNHTTLDRGLLFRTVHRYDVSYQRIQEALAVTHVSDRERRNNPETLRIMRKEDVDNS